MQFMEDVDSRLLDAFAPIAADLKSAGLKAKLRMESRVKMAIAWTAVLYVDGKRLGSVLVNPESPKENQVEWLAEQIQDYVLEFVWRGPEAVVWPRCRSGHNHPMALEHSADYPPRWPCWRCPFDRNVEIPIGELHHRNQGP